MPPLISEIPAHGSVFMGYMARGARCDFVVIAMPGTPDAELLVRCMDACLLSLVRGGDA